MIRILRKNSNCTILHKKLTKVTQKNNQKSFIEVKKKFNAPPEKYRALQEKKMMQKVVYFYHKTSTNPHKFQFIPAISVDVTSLRAQ